MKKFILVLFFPFLTGCLDPWTIGFIAAGLGGMAGYLTRDKGVVVKAPIAKVASPKELEEENRALEMRYEQKIQQLEQRMERMEAEQKK